MGLTTQVSKKTEILSNSIRESKKKIGNVSIFRLNIELENTTAQLIEALEVLENYEKIEDMNYRSFVLCMEKIARHYNDKAFEKIINNMHYKKSTIAFLKMILNHFNVSNSLSKYLSYAGLHHECGQEDLMETYRAAGLNPDSRIQERPTMWELSWSFCER